MGNDYTLREIHLGMLITAQSLIFKDDLTKEELENIRLELELLATGLNNMYTRFYCNIWRLK